MASGHVKSASIGRTHGCSDQTCDVKKVLANAEPSTHGTRLKSSAVQEVWQLSGGIPAVVGHGRTS
jgi:hypothetical protein